MQNLSVSASVCQSELAASDLNHSDASVCVTGSFNSSSLNLSISSNDPKLSKPKFDFLYKRTCFRLMSEYYKHIFQASGAKGKKVSRNFRKLMKSFCESEHMAPIFERLPSRAIRNYFYT